MHLVKRLKVSIRYRAREKYMVFPTQAVLHLKITASKKYTFKYYRRQTTTNSIESMSIIVKQFIPVKTENIKPFFKRM